MENKFFSRFFKARLGNLEIAASLNSSLAMPTVRGEGDGRRDDHFHAQYELFVAGDEPLIIKIGETALSVRRAAVCIPPFTPHTVRRPQGTYCFCFEMRRVGNAEVEGAVYPTMQSLLSEVRPLQIADTVYTDLWRLERAYHSTAVVDEQAVSALLRLIFWQLYEGNATVAATDGVAAVNDYCIVIDQIVNTRYTERITLSTVAEALHLSTKQTARIICKRYRATLSELLTEKRLQVAAALLRDGDRSVSDIASFLFGRSENYFYRLFRAKYGLSPLAYRKAAR